MANDLLAKEKEYHRLNMQLEQKARNLIEEVNTIMKHTDCVTTNPIDNACKNNTLESENYINKSCVANKITMSQKSSLGIKRNVSLPHIFKQNISSVEQATEVGNHGENIVTNEANTDKTITQFLTVKIDMLYKELQMIQFEYRNKIDYCKELEVENKSFKDTNIKLHVQIDSLKETIAKLESNNNNLQMQLHSLNTEYTTSEKCSDELKKEVRSLNRQLNSHDLRMNRFLEDNEKLRNALKLNSAEEKELRSQIRNLQETKNSVVKNLQKQQLELVQVIKKQMLSIDNLKKQNAYLISVGHVNLTKQDFLRLLNWKPQYS